MTTNTQKEFNKLGIASEILKILTKLSFHIPTPIQEQSIPIAIQGNDMIGIAQTGTGKTLAFGIPLIQQIIQKNGFGLILVPTRELAIQIQEALEKICFPLGIIIATLVGGEAIPRQLRQLSRNPRIVIATPGRLIDHLKRKTITLENVSMLVLDEADRMLDMGFAPQINKIIEVLPYKRQTMFFSATMPAQVVTMAQKYLKLPIRVEVARQGSAAQNVTHELFFVRQELKPSLFENILYEYKGTILVFVKMKHNAGKIAKYIRALGHTAAEIHSNRSLSQRREALHGFKTGKYRVLVATDVAARGIDVQNIELVINYDMPNTAGDYVHRIGRTGRAGESGHSISFARPNEKKDVRDIERLIRITLPISKLPKLRAPMEGYEYKPEEEPRSRRFGKKNGQKNRKTRPFIHSREKFTKFKNKR